MVIVKKELEEMILILVCKMSSLHLESQNANALLHRSIFYSFQNSQVVFVRRTHCSQSSLTSRVL